MKDSGRQKDRQRWERKERASLVEKHPRRVKASLWGRAQGFFSPEPHSQRAESARPNLSSDAFLAHSGLGPPVNGFDLVFLWVISIVFLVSRLISAVSEGS